MLHTSDNIECPEEHLKSLLKVFSMFKISIIYDDTIDDEDVPEAVGITYINCGKIIGSFLDNQKIETFITTFVTSMVFHNIVLSWIIQSNKNPGFDFQKNCPPWILNGPWHKTTICSRLHGSVFEDYLKTSKCDKRDIMGSI